MKSLAIIGGGAAGLAAAIAAGERARALAQPLRIVVFESDERVGRSILATGNGRCNFSNAYINVSDYYNSAFVDETFHAVAKWFGRDYVHEFFASIGLVWREEADGRQYPLANKASVVVDVLRAAAAEYGMREACNAQVSAIEPPREAGKPFTLRMSDGVFERADAVIIACGGRALEKLEVHAIPRLPLRPMLGPLKVAPADIPFTRELDNIRVRCSATLSRKNGPMLTRIATETGELMFRKYGVSGICVFNLSRFAEEGDVLRIDFLNVGGAEQAERLLVERRDRLALRFGEGITYEMLLRGLLLPRVYEAVLKAIDVSQDAVFSSFDAARLARALCAFPLEVAGIADPDISQVRRGGFEASAFDSATMQALEQPGLFAAGEALDVDGPCGGYNLHWAWSSGILAGRSAANLLV